MALRRAATMAKRNPLNPPTPSLSKIYRRGLLVCSIAVFGFFALAAGCSSPQKIIGVSIQNPSSAFYQKLILGVRTEAQRSGYAVIIDGAENDAEQQSQVEDFISKDVNAIIIVPYDSQMIAAAIAEANAANIPVFTADIASTEGEAHVFAHVASDNVAGGRQAARLLCTAMGMRGPVAILDEGQVASVQDRVRGFRDELHRSCRGLSVVADADVGGQKQKAADIMAELLQTRRDLRGVFAINDDTALGALAAIRTVRRQISVVGYDATERARKAIAKGQLYGDVVQYPYAIGSTTIHLIGDTFAGRTPPHYVTIGVGVIRR